MTIQQAIEKAMGGGWKKAEHMESFTTKFLAETFIYEILFDRIFWKSLGKEIGWDNHVFLYNDGSCVRCNGKGIYEFINGKENNDSWRVYWHRFIDFLADGKSIEDYFASLDV